MPYLLFLKKQHNIKLSSAANYRWSFFGESFLDQKPLNKYFGKTNSEDPVAAFHQDLHCLLRLNPFSDKEILFSFQKL